MTREQWFGSGIAAFLKTWTRLLRIELEDRCGLSIGEVAGPVIWAFWHNRMFVMPVVARRFFPNRSGAVLTSPSRDGTILAEVMRCFGQRSVRGSSSRRGAVALRELAAITSGGGDVAITPDGPRGPRYHLHPGIILLAQQTGTPIIPVGVEYSGCWRIGRWDRFMIPKPFARVSVAVGDRHIIPPTDSDAAFEAERAEFERILRAMNPTD
jgi:lysophospholipid acyltransferase (LPLAT)-like uncharacterized protein